MRKIMSNVDFEKRLWKAADTLRGSMDASEYNIADRAEEHNIEKSKKDLGNMEAILGADETIYTLCKDILKHYGERKHILEGKAMVVAYSQRIAIKIYKRILEIDKSFENKMSVVMTHKMLKMDRTLFLVPITICFYMIYKNIIIYLKKLKIANISIRLIL